MNPFETKAETAPQQGIVGQQYIPNNIVGGLAQAPEPAPHAERIMELYRRVGELENALNEAAQRIMRLERRVGD